MEIIQFGPPPDYLVDESPVHLKGGGENRETGACPLDIYAARPQFI